MPVIGCKCVVCASGNPRDKRLRSAALLQVADKNIVIDCGPDFRQQMLRNHVEALDAIIITHQHNDHVIGLDDVRPFNFMHRRDMPIYATNAVHGELRRRFAYAFDKDPYPGAPQFRLIEINKDVVFEVENIQVQPIEIMHGNLPILGFRIGDLTYLTDVKSVSDVEIQKIKGTKILITSALHHKPHYSHSNLSEAIEFVQRIQPEQAYLTHMSHSMGLYEEVSKTLPVGIQLAYDGLEINLS